MPYQGYHRGESVAAMIGCAGFLDDKKTKKMSMHDLVDQAHRYAVEAHSRINHRRKYSSAPYDVHLKNVAEIVASVTADPEMISAAWLHDVIEDTPASFLDLEREFSRELADLVSEVTDVSRTSDGNRATRKAIDRAHLATGCGVCQDLSHRNDGAAGGPCRGRCRTLRPGNGDDAGCPFGKPAYLAGIVYAMMWRDSFVPALIQQDGTLPFSL
jgi:hypothetical protein